MSNAHGFRNARSNCARLSFETLEARLTLSASSAGGTYNQISAAWFGAPASQGVGNGPPASDATRWIVRLTEEAVVAAPNVHAAADLLDGLPIRVERGLGLTGQLLVTSSGVGGATVASALATAAEIAAFRRDTTIGGAALPPDDPDFVNQYALLNTDPGGVDIDILQAWDITVGSTDVVTAVIDSGVDFSHPDLQSTRWTNPLETPGNGIDDDENGFIDDVHGWDFINNDNNPTDDHGHGTHIAGTIAATADNGQGVSGVNQVGTIMALKFLGADNVGTVADAISAINYVTAMKNRGVNVPVINASWGGPGADDEMLRDAIALAGDAGVLFVAAAGNGDVFGRGQNIDQLPFYPASFNLDNMVTVAATDRLGNLTTFSNFGVGAVQIAAPGQSILSSTLQISENTAPMPIYGFRSGTSMAAPHVAGVATLIWASFPDAPLDEVRQALLDGNEFDADLTGSIEGGRRLNAAQALLHLPPQASLAAAPDVTSVGGDFYDFDVFIASNDTISQSALSSAQLTVRRADVPDELLIAEYVNGSAVTDAAGDVTATFRITLGDDGWTELDVGIYEIFLPQEQIADIKGVYANPKMLGSFVVDLASDGVFRPDVATDGADDNLADGVPFSNGHITLRAAVQEANLLSPQRGIIILAPGTYDLTEQGAVENDSVTGDLDITGNVTIVAIGAGEVVIDAGGLGDRVFDVHAGGALTLQGVKLANGHAILDHGGGVRVRGGGTLELNDAAVVDNAADLDGGGIHNAGVVEMFNATVSSNAARGNGGGVFNAEGATADLTSSTLSGNSATGEVVFDFTKDGDVVRLDNGASGARRDPRIAFNSLGEAVAVWTDIQSPNLLIYALRLNADGSKNGGEFRVNSATLPDDAELADVALHDDGSFAVVYQYDSNSSSSNDWELGFSSFDPSNARVSAETVTLDSGTGFQYLPHIATADNGDYMVAWTHTASYMGIGVGYDVIVQRIDETGSSVGPGRIVNSTLGGHQRLDAMTRLADGNYAIVWEDLSGLDGSGLGIFVRRVDSSGLPIGFQTQANTTTAGNQIDADIGAVADGFVATWWDVNGVYARIYDMNGTPSDTELVVSGSGVGTGNTGGNRVSVAGLPDDTFVVAWAEVTARGVPTNSVFMSRYDFSGVPQGETTLSSTASLSGGGPTLRAAPAASLTNRAFALWDGHGGAAGIAGQKLILQEGPSGEGGGIANAGNLQLVNVTISGNSASDDDLGHGLLNRSTGVADLLQVTMTQNDGPAAAHAVVNEAAGVITLQNTIVAGNSQTTGAADLLGSFDSEGGNLIGDVGDATGISHGVNGDQAGDSGVTIDPLLQPLGPYGGKTLTHAPLAGSPAIDRGLAPGAPLLDQRGVVRARDGDNDGTAEPDVGAIETYYASITGRKFFDLNSDGLQDPGEPGLAGWTIFLDEDGDGRLDPDERRTVTRADDPATAGVDEAGTYELFQIVPGQYHVLEVQQEGWERTFAPVRYASETTTIDVTSLTRAQELAMSPDGRHVYVLNDNPAAPDTLTVFERDDLTGDLSLVPGATLTNGQNDSLGTAVDGLEGRAKLVFSPDGLTGYAIGDEDDHLTSLNRDPTTGVLTVREVLPLPGGVTGIVDIKVTSDHENVYLIGSSGDALVDYLRLSGSGNLVQTDSFPVAGTALGLPADTEHLYVATATELLAYDRLPQFAALVAAPGLSLQVGVDDPSGGLGGVVDIAVSDDGQFLYTLAAGDNAVGVFGRNPATGELQYFGATSLDGLAASADSLTISPQGDRVYVAADQSTAGFNGAVVILERDTTTGLLTHLETLNQRDLDADAPNGRLFTLGDPGPIVASPDGRHFYVPAAAPLGSSGAVTRFRRDEKDFDLRNLAIADALTDVNFSNFARHGEVRGTIYNDPNQNGVRDPGELGLQGVVVYPDYNGNGDLDAGAETDDAAMTGVFGEYVLTPLDVPATYKIRVTTDFSEVVTAAEMPGNDEWIIDLSPDELRTGVDFLLFIQIGGVNPNQVSGAVFQDDNSNGIRDGSEDPLVGRLVYADLDDNGVYDSSTDIMALNPTDAGGNYTIVGIPNTEFSVRIIANAGETTRNPVGNAFQLLNFDTGDNPAAMITGDFNNDGRLDLANVNNSEDTVGIRFLNAQGQFEGYRLTDVNASPTSLAAIDFNDDDLLDLAVVHWGTAAEPGTILFLRNLGDNTFQAQPSPISIPNGRSTIVAADFDHDDDDDLAVVVAAAGGDVLRVYLNQQGATPNFTLLQDVSLGNVSARSLAVGDLNGDVYPDLVVGGLRPALSEQPIPILINNAGQSFSATASPILPFGPVGVAVADVVGDSNNDLIVTSVTASAVSILAGDGQGGFTPAQQLGAGAGPQTVTAADIDDDGDVDLIVGTALDDSVYILRNGPTGFSFAEGAGVGRINEVFAPGVRAVLAEDWDGNGFIDLAAIRGSSETGSLAVLYNFAGAGSHRFPAGEGRSLEDRDFGIVAASVAQQGDYNGDGKVTGSDFLVWQRELGATGSSPADGNGSGTVDAVDLGIWEEYFGTGQSQSSSAVPGDYDINGRVAGRDFLVWQREFGTTSPSLADGDGSGDVDGVDLAIWQQNFGVGTSFAGSTSTSSGAGSPVGIPPEASVVVDWASHDAALDIEETHELASPWQELVSLALTANHHSRGQDNDPRSPVVTQSVPPPSLRQGAAKSDAAVCGEQWPTAKRQSEHRAARQADETESLRGRIRKAISRQISDHILAESPIAAFRRRVDGLR